MSCPVQDIPKYRIVCSPHRKQHRWGSGCGLAGHRSEMEQEKQLILVYIFLIVLLHSISHLQYYVAGFSVLSLIIFPGFSHSPTLTHSPLYRNNNTTNNHLPLYPQPWPLAGGSSSKPSSGASSCALECFFMISPLLVLLVRPSLARFRLMMAMYPMVAKLSSTSTVPRITIPVARKAVGYPSLSISMGEGLHWVALLMMAVGPGASCRKSAPWWSA